MKLPLVLYCNDQHLTNWSKPFEKFGGNCDPKIDQKTSIRASLIEISDEPIILSIIQRLVRNFDWGRSNRGFLVLTLPVLCP